MDIEKHLQAVPDELFIGRNDAADPRLGENVTRGVQEYETADVVLIACPQDEGVRRNQGRVGTAKAPMEIRRALYKSPYREDLLSVTLCDLGDVKIAGSLEETHEIHETIVRQVLADKKRIIVVGGGNDISYPDICALASVHKNLFAINIDSHFDVRRNEIRNSGTPYRQLLDENIITGDNFIETAQKQETVPLSNIQFLASKNVRIVWLEELKQQGAFAFFTQVIKTTKAHAIFWGIDMDAVRSAEAPGVSAPFPVGLTADEICEIGTLAGSDPRSKVLELTEVNPEYDVDNRTSRLAALVILKFLYGMSQKRIL
jgi:formiminoglutamase